MENKNLFNFNLITVSGDGYEIFIDTTMSHLMAHEKDYQNNFMPEMAKLLSKTNIEGKPFLFVEGEANAVVGFNRLVETTKEDNTYWAPRPERNFNSRLVTGREPEETKIITVGICKHREYGIYCIFTAFPGPKAPKELNDPRLTDAERPEAEAFWATHALIA